MAATIGNRITDLIGSDYSSIPANSKADLINAAINEIADMLPAELLLKYAVNPADLDESTPTWTVMSNFGPDNDTEDYFGKINSEGDE